MYGNILYVVIPCYNEEEVLPETARRLKDKMEDLIKKRMISEASKVIFVNDGSKDCTWELIEKLHEKDYFYGGINLTRNKTEVISMDADLQDDINAVDEMVEKYQSGIDIVYGVRSSRAKDTFFKRATAEGFYKTMKFLGADTVFNHADYRLMSKRAIEGLAKFKEVNLFLRGIIPMVGYPSDFVYYERGERFAGESKYPLKKMLAFAVEGITSLSIRPIRLITVLGFFIFLISIMMLVYSFIRHFMGATIIGWTTLMVSIWATGGLILLSLGVVGEYIGKIYLETKGRPQYLVEKFLHDKAGEDVEKDE